jgi:acyl-CoA thioester hydrolase
MNFYHSLPLQIRFNDVDLAQHVNNAVYQEFFDLGRLSYFREVMGKTIEFSGLSLVIASFKVDFFQPVFLYDKIEVSTKISGIGIKSLEMTQQISGEGESSIKAVSSSVLVCFNFSEKMSEILPEEWKKKIQEFENFECTAKQG